MRTLLTLFLVGLVVASAFGVQAEAANLEVTLYTNSSISTDTTDYAPGDSVVIEASGFWADETVTLDVANVFNPGLGDTAPPWDVVADGSGSFETYWIVPPDGVDQTFELTAIGQSSGIEASTTFTDANTKLRFAVSPPSEACVGSEIYVCASLRENCGHGDYAPLEDREILFFITAGNCGVNVGQSADETVLTDENGLACATLTVPGPPGTYSIRIKFLGESKPGWWDPPNSACDPSKRTKLSAANRCEELQAVSTLTTPVVTLPNDTTIYSCDASQVCLPVLIEDAECDVDTVETNIGGYAGSTHDFDEISRITQLGGTATQVGGGAPGTILTSASDFVPPVNTQSGVSVTLPNFVFANSVVDYGSFPGGYGPAQSADQLKGSPTDLTFTLPGWGGPDGGSGDGSVDFSTGNEVTLGFPSMITTCDGANVDLFFFTNSGGSGDAEVLLLRDGIPVHSVVHTFPGATAGTALGGVTLDLIDGLEFNEVRIKCVSSTIELDAVAARVSASSSTEDICFLADTSGVYPVIVTATDNCGNTGGDTTYVTVVVNHPPVANAGTDFDLFVCDFNEQCFGVSFSDPDNNLATTALVSGPGSLVGSQVCFTPTYEGTYTFIIQATDSCGLSDRDTVVATIAKNSAPVATAPPAKNRFLCASEQLCYTFAATDPEGDDLAWSLLSGAGAISTAGEFCFTPDTSGTYVSTVAVSDTCGAADTVSITYNITLNTAPIATDPSSPKNLFLCTSQQVCYQFAATDGNAGPLSWTMLSGTGTVSAGGEWCFQPIAPGSYSVSAEVVDTCGAADTVSLTYNVSFNGPPTVAFGADTTVDLCAQEEICVAYAVTDPQGPAGLVEDMISGFGAIDTAANEVCFTPTTSGSYEIIVEATDSCGQAGRDTILVTVNFGATVSISCPGSAVAVSLCEVDSVCQAIAVTPSNAAVSVSYGTYIGGELCFLADTSGTYEIQVIADAECGSDTCDVTFNVDIGEAAQIACPDPQTLFICETDSVCIPVGVVGGGAVVTVSPIGSYHAGNVCFLADTSGHYEISVTATTSCGSDNCTVVADITINSPPVAVDPPSPVDTFFCTTGQFCVQFAAGDGDGGPLNWSRLSGNGTVSSSGEWCFNVTGSGSKSVTAVVTDSCGAADTLSLTYNISVNAAPTIALGPDTTVFLCDYEQVCLPFTFSDANGNFQGFQLVSGTATILTAPPRLCFTPAAETIYGFIVRVTDSCGAVDEDTIEVTVELNRRPLVDAGSDQTIFQCTPSEICWPAGATDVDGNLQTIELVTGPGTFDGSDICFTPTGTYNYEFVLKATDSCGAEGYDTVAIYYTENSAPVANAGPDQTIFQCTASQICWPASCSDVDGNLANCALIEGPGTYNGSDICFTPTGSGSYRFVLEAEDGCGLADRDTVDIDVTINSDPVCSVPNDTTIFQCAAAEVCLPVTGTDADGNLDYCQIVSGPGTLSGGNWCYTPVASQVVTVQVQCVDSCGAVCQSEFTVEFEINREPAITFATPTSTFLCDSEQVCIGYTAADPDVGQPTTISLVSGPGSLDQANSRVCFTPTVSGNYDFIIRIDDDCGAFDQDTVTVPVTLNSPPVADAGGDQTVTLCTAQQLCWPAGCSDVDLNLISCDFSGPGTYNGSEICFTPGASGAYEFILTAADACGEISVDTATITVTVNASPAIAFGGDSTLSFCNPEEICLTYSVSDPDGPALLTEQLVSGSGAIDTAANEVCFTPAIAGQYEIVVGVSDSCGAYDEDTIIVTVDFGSDVAITCPTGPIDVFLCGVDSVIQTVAVNPTSASVALSYGVYEAGAVRFLADTAGSYTITMVATEACGVDTCDLEFDVAFNSPPVADAGSDVSLFKCDLTQICRPASCSDVDGNLSTCELTSGPGTYDGSNICFTPTGSGAYEFILKATDACGAEDFDTVVVTVDINEAPTIAFQSDSAVALCTPAEICVSYSVDDPNGLQGLIEDLVSGFGTIDTTANEVCFTPTTAGSYEIIVSVEDSCGETALDTVVVDVSFGDVATIDCPTDTITASLCSVDSVCTLLDISPSGATVTTSSGTYANGQLCILADTSGIYVVEVIADAECSVDTCEVVFDVDIGQQAQISCPQPSAKFICEPGTVCVPVSVVSPGGSVTVSPIGSYSSGNVCFTADSSGHYELKVVASTPCGSDSCEISVDVTINSSPVAVDPATPVDTFICANGQICYQFAATDADGGSLDWSRLSGNGTVTSSGLWCFSATGDGTYSVVAVVTDSCGAADTTTLTYDVDKNAAPVVSLPADNSISLCDGEAYCFNYTTSDADGNAGNEILVSATGSIDTSANEICFVPPTDGTYEFIVRYTDSCGASSEDTTRLTVDVVNSPAISCPAPSAASLCSTDSICRSVSVSPTSATITVSPIGSYAGGDVCFLADTSGHYELLVVATTPCGADSCTLEVDVTINAAPIAVDPPTPVDTFVCSLGQVCYQFDANDVDGGTLNWVRLSGNGTVSSSGLWCFNPMAAGTYTVVAQVSDACGAADTVTLTYNIATNTPPTVQIVDNRPLITICASEELCYDYTVNDAEDNVVLETLAAGLPGGTIDTSANEVCFTPTSSGTYTIIVTAEDSCGAVGADTLEVDVEFNTAPVASAGADQSLFQCTADEICWSAGCTDADNNVDSCYLASGPGTFDGSEICFTPATSGTFEFVLRAVDLCGAADEDTVLITVELNEPPICQLPPDTSFFQCAATQVSLPVGADDPNGNFDHCELLAGPGSLVGGNWVFTPTADQSVSVRVMCLDSCGASCIDSFTVDFRLNRAPEVTQEADSVYFICDPTTLCWDVAASDVDNNLATVELTSPFGTYDPQTGKVCATIPLGDGLDKWYTFIVTATDSCGAIDRDTTTIRVDFNAAPTLDVPPNFVAFIEQPGELCFDATVEDEDDNLDVITVSPIGTWANDQVCFNADTAGTYCFEITATDHCGEEATELICVTVEIDECLHVQIEKVHDALQGQFNTVNIYLQGGAKELGGFDFLISYDQSGMLASTVEPGPLFENCGWEYFQYRFGAEGNCGGCPSGLLRIVGIAETNNGAYHPGCFLQGLVGSLAKIRFLVSNDRNLNCQYLPITFFWMDCGDNSLSSRGGDTLWVVRSVYDFEHNNITDHSIPLPSSYGLMDSCLATGLPAKTTPIRCVDFTNGGLDLICSDSIDAAGDINLNGIAYEVADAVMFSNYFVEGLDAFGPAQQTQGSVAATEVNGDGVTLTVADLVYLIRVVTGDALPMPKVRPGDELEVELAVVNGVLSVSETLSRIGAIHVILEGRATPELAEGASRMQMRYEYDGSDTRVLVYSPDGDKFIEAGPVLRLNGQNRVKTVEVGAYDGYVLNARIANLPDHFELSQNYPNPFNPTTTIEFALPVKSEWNLTVYNVLGQVVERWEDESEAGYLKIEWDAREYASGVYFYRFRAGDFSATRKMVLIK